MLLGIYPEKIIVGRYIHLSVHCRTIYNSQDMEAIQVSINGVIDNQKVVSTQNGILVNFKKEGDPDIGYSVMDLEHYYA